VSDVVSGNDELTRKLQQLQTLVPGGTGKAMLAGALILEGHIKQSMQEGHHGRIYSRGGHAHQASAPGETPAIDFGHLVNSIESSLIDETSSQVATNSEAAPSLEFGTAHVAARPFMRPAVDEHEEDVVNAVSKTILRLVKEATK
jgi:HK97 gp10 family phage protein